MQILLAKLEDKEVSFLPFGLLYVADALQQKGFEVEIFHEIGNKRNISRLVEESENKLFIGFTVHTGMGFLETIEASKKIKANSNTKIVWGGIHPTMLPSQTLEQDYIDIIITGEGEITSQLLAERLSKNKSIDNIKGINLNERREPIRDLDRFSPAWNLIDIERYIRPNKKWDRERVTSMVTSRGCPYRCSFCYNQIFNYRKWRSHSIGFVLKQINFLKTFDLDGIIFHDDNLFVDMGRAFEIIEKTNLSWFAEARANYYTDNFVKRLKQTSCGMIHMGGESGNERILKVLKKDITVEQITRGVRLCKKYNVRLTISFMLGIPTETKREMLDTIKLIWEITRLYHFTDIDLKIYNPYPGVPLWRGDIPDFEDWSLIKRSRVVPWSGSSMPGLEYVVKAIKKIVNLNVQRNFRERGLIK